MSLSQISEIKNKFKVSVRFKSMYKHKHPTEFDFHFLFAMCAKSVKQGPEESVWLTSGDKQFVS